MKQILQHEKMIVAVIVVICASLFLCLKIVVIVCMKKSLFVVCECVFLLGKNIHLFVELEHWKIETPNDGRVRGRC